MRTRIILSLFCILLIQLQCISQNILLNPSSQLIKNGNQRIEGDQIIEGTQTIDGNSDVIGDLKVSGELKATGHFKATKNEIDFADGSKQYKAAETSEYEDVPVFQNLFADFGSIVGDVTVTDYEGSMNILDFDYTYNFDSRGALQHNEFMMLKAIDKATPALYKGLQEETNFPEVEFYFLTNLGDGTLTTFYNIVFRDVKLKEIRQNTLSTGSKMLERVFLNFETAILTYSEYDNSGVFVDSYSVTLSDSPR